jgi:hypothetical protein
VAPATSSKKKDMSYCGNALVVATGFSKHLLERGLALPVITAISSSTGFDDLARDRIGR